MDSEDLGQPLGGDPDGQPGPRDMRNAAERGQPIAQSDVNSCALRIGQEAARHQRVVQLVFVTRLRGGFGADAVDRGGIERAQVAGRRRLARAPRLDGVRPPLLEWRVVQERVGLRVQNLVREERRLGCVARDELDLAIVNAPQHLAQAVEVHGLLQAVAYRLVDQRVIGNLPIARNVLEARCRVGEHGRHQIVREHPLYLRRHFAAAAIARHGERNRGVPTPARREHRGVEKRLHQDVARGLRMQIPEHVGERKRMLRSKRQEQRVVGRGSLQFEIELAAESLAEREAPGLVDAAPERGVQDELHAAGFVEEPFEHERLLCGDDAERAPSLGEVRDGLFRRLLSQSCVFGEPAHGGVRLSGSQPAIHLAAKIAHGARQLIAPCRRLSQPERNGRRRSRGVGDAHRAAGHLEHAPGRVPQLEDVASTALDREVFVERADERLFRLEHDPVVGDFGNRPTRGLREQPRAAAPAHRAVDFVTMNERRPAAAPRREPFSGHRQHRVEVLAVERAIRPGAAHQAEQLRIRVFAARGLGDDLLGQHVERRVRD